MFLKSCDILQSDYSKPPFLLTIFKKNKMFTKILYCLFSFFVLIPITTMGVDFGQPGEPVHLVVGHEPYHTGTWSGIIMDGKNFWKKYLPADSTVEFQAKMKGTSIVDELVCGKQYIGYMGNMPAIAATFRNLKPRGGVDLRIVAVSGISQQMCNIFLVRSDAPSFENVQKALQWMQGKVVATRHGSCLDRFARLVFHTFNIKPDKYLSSPYQVLEEDLKDKSVDVVLATEPIASKFVELNLARKVATGKDFDIWDGSFIVMLNDLLIQRPDVVKGWLQAELDAQLFMSDATRAHEVIRIVKQRTPNLNEKILWEALYGGNGLKLQFDFIVTDAVKKILDDTTAFLYSLPNKPAAEPQIRKGGINDEMARQVLKERQFQSPVGVIKASQ